MFTIVDDNNSKIYTIFKRRAEIMTIEKSKRILVVDDDKTITGLIQAILIKQGYVVYIAHNGIEAEKIALEVKPNLIFMDITMPDQDGYETTERIKNNPELYEIPIVFITGKSESEDKGKSFAKGGVSFICKPFEKQQLISLASLILESANVD